jgi:hypothetical protein
MSDSQEHQEPKPAPRKAAARKQSTEEQESEAVKTDDERYVGVDPIYKQTAYEEPLEAEGEPAEVEGATDEENEAAKEAAEAEAEMLERVKANEEGVKVEVDEPESFEDWLPHSAIGVRKNLVRGLDEEQVEADKAATEEAKGDDGKIPPRSTSTQQPGVANA